MREWRTTDAAAVWGRQPVSQLWIVDARFARYAPQRRDTSEVPSQRGQAIGGLTCAGGELLYECMHTHQQALLDTIALKQDGVPIYVQLREQILLALGARVLRPGDQMPTMRQVAITMRIDLNTVRHAYDELERLGAITLVRGRGSFVAETAAVIEEVAGRLDDLARQALAMAAAIGVDPKTLANRIIVLSRQKEPIS